MVQLAPQERPVLMEQSVQRVLREQLVRREPMVLQALLVPPEQQELMEPREPQVRPVPMER